MFHNDLNPRTSREVRLQNNTKLNRIFKLFCALYIFFVKRVTLSPQKRGGSPHLGGKRMCEPPWETMIAYGSLDQQAILRVIAALRPKVLYAVSIAVAKIVKPQTVRMLVHDFTQLGL